MALFESASCSSTQLPYWITPLERLENFDELDNVTLEKNPVGDCTSISNSILERELLNQRNACYSQQCHVSNQFRPSDENRPIQYDGYITPYPYSTESEPSAIYPSETWDGYHQQEPTERQQEPSVICPPEILDVYHQQKPTERQSEHQPNPRIEGYYHYCGLCERYIPEGENSIERHKNSCKSSSRLESQSNPSNQKQMIKNVDCSGSLHCKLCHHRIAKKAWEGHGFHCGKSVSKCPRCDSTEFGSKDSFMLHWKKGCYCCWCKTRHKGLCESYPHTDIPQSPQVELVSRICKHCKLTVTDEVAIKAHAQFCGKVASPYRCTFCAENFKRLGNFIRHWKFFCKGYPGRDQSRA